MGSETYLDAVTRCGWCGPTLLVVDTDGWVGRHTLSGWYFRETRYLSLLRLELFGERPHLAALGDVAPRSIEATFQYPPVARWGGGGSGSGRGGRTHGLWWRSLDLDLEYALRPASLAVRLRLGCRFDDEVRVPLAWRVAADFADLVEAETGERQQQAAVEASAAPQGVRLDYRHPQLPFATVVTVEWPGEWRFADGAVTGEVVLRRQEQVDVLLRIRAEHPDGSLDEDEEERRLRLLQGWSGRVTRVRAPGDSPLATLVDRALQDTGSLALLEGEEDEWLAPAAGMPLYPALFGRDAFTMGWHIGVLDGCEMLEAAYNRLTRVQGTEWNDWRDEQPGRSVQQVRAGPLARLGVTPFGRYYGDYASPMMFVISLAQMYAWRGDRALLDRHWDAALASLEWARKHGDLDGDGYLEYETRSPMGPRHQGWKDSDDAVVDERGEPVPPPIATCEVQGYWFAALEIMATLAMVRGEKALAAELGGQAAALKERFNRDFWLEEEGFLAFGLDAQKRPIPSIASNAGQCLVCGIVDRERVPRLARRLFQPDLWSGWGIRTLSTANPSYNPLDYHLGSVWPSENAVIVLGLRRYGLDELALLLAGGLYDLAWLWRDQRMPECVGGYARAERTTPGAYPNANSPQGWNQSGWAVVLQALLGLQPLASRHLLLVDPVLPSWAPDIELVGLRVGEARVDLRLWRDGKGRTHHQVRRKEGKLRVLRQPPPESLTASVADRLLSLAHVPRKRPLGRVRR
jgi:glycogen debranching enzyme